MNDDRVRRAALDLVAVTLEEFVIDVAVALRRDSRARPTVYTDERDLPFPEVGDRQSRTAADGDEVEDGHTEEEWEELMGR